MICVRQVGIEPTIAFAGGATIRCHTIIASDAFLETKMSKICTITFSKREETRPMPKEQGKSQLLMLIWLLLLPFQGLKTIMIAQNNIMNPMMIPISFLPFVLIDPP